MTDKPEIDWHKDGYMEMSFETLIGKLDTVGINNSIERTAAWLLRQFYLEQQEILSICGAALNYPQFCDDPKNFPDATKSDGRCVGDHVAASIVTELAELYELRYKR